MGVCYFLDVPRGGAGVSCLGASSIPTLSPSRAENIPGIGGRSILERRRMTLLDPRRIFHELEFGALIFVLQGPEALLIVH